MRLRIASAYVSVSAGVAPLARGTSRIRFVAIETGNADFARRGHRHALTNGAYMRKLLPVVLCTVSAPAQTTRPTVYRVDEHVFHGKQPDKGDIPALVQMGIKAVLDLRGGTYRPWERQAVGAAGMRYIRIGISGLFAPTDRQMQCLKLRQIPPICRLPTLREKVNVMKPAVESERQ
jgi:hypothetical protein